MFQFCALTSGEDSQTLSLYCQLGKTVYLFLDFRPGPPVHVLHHFTPSLAHSCQISLVIKPLQDHSPSSLLPPNLTWAIGKELFFTLPHFIKVWFPKFSYVSLTYLILVCSYYSACSLQCRRKQSSNLILYSIFESCIQTYHC